ncbi:ATP-grasp domain-containing protein [Paraburkholderia sp. SEWSISQ10-3 4]|uniref:ATP-grasp domain-containing protein n=1 Tax=Paraburkholderia TaxID=1822464 RepID=UPI00225A034D|nr:MULTISPECIES: ATP-grasp domain-containing protein [Paraburkholderia]MCX4140714.1 ATP-grasp domain-containing protein [Paraburkholderia aspalathi]MDN7173398.1 ATP-grasp domain-containing protein [Paraburkholderia sp. SEWSISQ10-3 4]MDQ6503039.1 ATP-grasp domain-containing protein [Paraburkholderia aspalathi]
MKQQRQAVVIVGADSKGYYIAPTLQGRGYQCIHVDVGDLSRKKPGNSSCFTTEFRLPSDDDWAITDLVAKLNRYSVKAVLAAGDTGVVAANKIAQCFDVPRNPAGSWRFHRHKYHMIEALRHEGVACSEQFVSNRIDGLLSWYRSNDFTRVVMKPSLGGYSDGVGICENEREIVSVFEKNINKINCTGKVNDEYVIQEFLEGRHYVVNTVSVEGTHFVTDVWLDVNHHENTFLIDEYSDSVSRQSPEFATVSSYVGEVLDALQIRNGPAHSEVMLTADGPRLIETGARLAGGLDFSIVEECHGYSQISVLADSLIAPHLFSSRTALYSDAPSRFARFVYMSADVSGRIRSEIGLNGFFEIPSLMSIKLAIQAGGNLERTQYSLGHPGYAMFLADSREELCRDYARFRGLERRFFEDLIEEPVREDSLTS